jgi:hypothetical protein
MQQPTSILPRTCILATSSQVTRATSASWLNLNIDAGRLCVLSMLDRADRRFWKSTCRSKWLGEGGSDTYGTG